MKDGKVSKMENPLIIPLFRLILILALTFVGGVILTICAAAIISIRRIEKRLK